MLYLISVSAFTISYAALWAVSLELFDGSRPISLGRAEGIVPGSRPKR